jgi:hypothetical protein
MLAVPWVNFWISARRPYPPVRGWVMQQVVKLAAAAQLGADVLLLADSDVLFVRPLTEESFRADGRLRFYRVDGAVDARLPRHLIWHDVARRLLGLPPAGEPPLPEYISAFNVWDRRVVLKLRDRVEAVTHRPWLDAIASQLHVSEFVLYGVFVDEVLGPSANVFGAESMLCHSYWNTTPLTRVDATRFVQALGPDDVAVMLSAKSRTPLDVRRAALSTIQPSDPVRAWPPSARVGGELV